MRYFAATLETSFVIYETDDDITKYRILDARTIEDKKLNENPPTDKDIEETINYSDDAFVGVEWIPIDCQDYFLSFRDEISLVDVFAYKL